MEGKLVPAKEIKPQVPKARQPYSQESSRVPLPIPPALDQIRYRMLRTVDFQDEIAKTISDPREQITNYHPVISRSEEILSLTDKREREIINSTIGNSYSLEKWMVDEDLATFDNGMYRLERDEDPTIPSDERRVIDFSVSDPSFTLNYVLYGNDRFKLRIDFGNNGKREIAYETEKKRILDNLTPEEAEIIGYYSLNFLDSQREMVQQAA